MLSSEKSIFPVKYRGKEIRSWRELREEAERPTGVFDYGGPVTLLKPIARAISERDGIDFEEARDAVYHEIHKIRTEVNRKYPQQGCHIDILFPDSEKKQKALYTRLYNLFTGRRKIRGLVESYRNRN